MCAYRRLRRPPLPQPHIERRPGRRARRQPLVAQVQVHTAGREVGCAADGLLLLMLVTLDILVRLAVAMVMLLRRRLMLLIHFTLVVLCVLHTHTRRVPNLREQRYVGGAPLFGQKAHERLVQFQPVGVQRRGRCDGAEGLQNLREQEGRGQRGVLSRTELSKTDESNSVYEMENGAEYAQQNVKECQKTFG
jgi:hypothetical protein